VVPRLPEPLDDITLCGLAPRPEDRFQSALAMANALENAVPPATARRIAEWMTGLSDEVLTARRSRWAQLHGEAAAYEEGRPTVPTPPLDGADQTAAGSFATPGRGTSSTAQRPSRWQLALLLVIALGLFVVTRSGLSTSRTSSTMPPSSASGAADPVASVSPSPVQASPVPQSSTPAPGAPSTDTVSSMPTPVAPPSQRPPLPPKRTSTHATAAAAAAASGAEGQSSSPAPLPAPRCRNAKVPDDAGIIRLVPVCD
jgi:hypothetical protein